jgi:tRNA-uridine 2-sulfurtransferase
MVISGEVVGQRPMSQKKRDLARIAHHAGLEDHLLRPLSARLLPATFPERQKLVDRQRLFGISGRGRKELIALARQLGLRRIPQPSTGCALTEPRFAAKVHDLIGHDAAADHWQFELLKIGRHVRFDRLTKVVLGRREEENEQLVRLLGRLPAGTVTVIEPENFLGPTALVVGAATEAAVDFAAGLVLRYAKLSHTAVPRARVRNGSGEQVQPLGEQAEVSLAHAI